MVSRGCFLLGALICCLDFYPRPCQNGSDRSKFPPPDRSARFFPWLSFLVRHARAAARYHRRRRYPWHPIVPGLVGYDGGLTSQLVMKMSGVYKLNLWMEKYLKDYASEGAMPSWHKRQGRWLGSWISGISMGWYHKSWMVFVQGKSRSKLDDDWGVAIWLRKSENIFWHSLRGH